MHALSVTQQILVLCQNSRTYLKQPDKLTQCETINLYNAQKLALCKTGDASLWPSLH